MNIAIIEDIIKEIGKKHNAYCNFTITAGHTPDGKADYANATSYKTYINADRDREHQNHTTVQEAMNRFEKFLAIKDILKHDRQRLKELIREYTDEKENLEDDIKRLVTALNEDLQL